MVNYNQLNHNYFETFLIQKYGAFVLTLEEVSQELSVDVTDVEYLIDQGMLSAKLIKDKIRIPINSLYDYFCEDKLVTQQSNHNEKHLVNDLLYIILEEKKSDIKLSTYLWYRDNAKHIEQAFLGKYVENISSSDISNFLKDISKNNSGKDMSCRFMQAVTSLMKNIIRFAYERDYIKNNPFDYIHKLPKGVKGNPKERVLDKATILKLNAALENSPVFKPMVILMLRSGLRIGEVLALRWTDIDEDKGVIHVQCGLSVEYDEDNEGNPINKHYEIGNTKTICSVRDVTVDSRVFEILKEWKNYINSKPHMKIAISKKGNQSIVFVNKSGDIRSYQALRKSFKRFLVKNGLDEVPITFHRFRHTYASILSDAGVDINIIRDMLGHKDIQTTANIYVKVNLSPKKEATKKFESTIKETIGNVL